MADAGGIPCSCRFHLVTGSVADDRGVPREQPGFSHEHVRAPGAGQTVLYLCPTLAAHPGYTRRRLLCRLLLFAAELKSRQLEEEERAFSVRECETRCV